MKLDPFYLIVDRASWIERLGPLGLKLVQLRVKDLEDDDLRAEIRSAKSICDRLGVTLVINDFWQMAIEEKCNWIHLGQEDLTDVDLDAIRAAGLKFGLSSHDDAELDTAIAAKPDYIALGPVFPTILKKMKWAPQGLEKLRIWKERIGDIPLVAIGGLTPERASAALDHGADIASVVTDITLNDNPEARAKEWIAATAKARG
ncbi:thiamine-phosphate pyrophosphorylase [Roseibium sp. TrichSKD4]|uniref:thiamine phosphate synthase n=1 Tax=Roseibium sp. TrichSKD4 TaxID=744980 RepID=UPI0001E5652E|nr:thiamine phosphate synthase [Roseibium sp. TrichSKD4]EFO34044.1 thiamine-phosphate pyrophosphorylase [Roseibium sp. TrichSKD4]